MNIFFVSLGCDKNLVDSEVMLGIFHDKGYSFTDDEYEADVIVINTCGFINDAKEESINTIIEMAQLKLSAGNGGKCRSLIVTGCLAQRYFEEIKQELPEVDGIVGTTAYDKIVSVVERTLAGEFVCEIDSLDKRVAVDTSRIITTGGYYSYLKIAEGCNKNCTYCIIPKLRGKYSSVPMDKLIEEAKFLADSGVRELILVAQETTLYGVDIYGKKSLPKLLHSLCEIEGLHWIRLLYCYPEEITDELIETIRTEKKICNYIDMPIQHCSDEVLKRMGRRTNKKDLELCISKLRERIPDVTIRTTIISGFPGETEASHKELLEFVDTVEFDRLGVFTYSAEENTKAAEMDNQVQENVKEARRDEIMSLQQEIAYEHAQNMVGTVLEAMIEGKLVEEDVYAARTFMDAPAVDGLVFVKSKREHMSGDFVSVRIIAAKGYDLIGEIIDEFAE